MNVTATFGRSGGLAFTEYVFGTSRHTAAATDVVVRNRIAGSSSLRRASAAFDAALSDRNRKPVGHEKLKKNEPGIAPGS